MRGDGSGGRDRPYHFQVSMRPGWMYFQHNKAPFYFSCSEDVSNPRNYLSLIKIQAIISFWKHIQLWSGK